MNTTIAFDIYGTIIDINQMSDVIGKYIKTDITEFLKMFATKQLEYSFRRVLMGNYAPHPVITEDALNYCCLAYKIDLSSKQKQKILKKYTSLHAFSDVQHGLKTLCDKGYKLYAFSNGSKEDITSLLSFNHLETYFDGIVSVGDVKSTKPAPAAYQYLNEVTNSESGNTWLVSSNPFDIIGASEYGWNTVWCKRNDEKIMDPWFNEELNIVDSLDKVHEYIHIGE